MKVTKSFRLERNLIQRIRILAAQEDEDYMVDMVTILLEEALAARAKKEASK